MDEFLSTAAGMTDSERAERFGTVAPAVETLIGVNVQMDDLKARLAAYNRAEKILEIIKALKNGNARIDPSSNAGEVISTLLAQLEAATAHMPKAVPADIAAMDKLNGSVEALPERLAAALDQRKPAAIVLKKDRGQTSAVAVVNQDGTASEMPVRRI